MYARFYHIAFQLPIWLVLCGRQEGGLICRTQKQRMELRAQLYCRTNSCQKLRLTKTNKPTNQNPELETKLELEPRNSETQTRRCGGHEERRHSTRRMQVRLMTRQQAENDKGLKYAAELSGNRRQEGNTAGTNQAGYTDINQETHLDLEPEGTKRQNLRTRNHRAMNQKSSNDKP